MWRTIRIAVLLATLFLVGVSTWLDRHLTTSWQHTVWVGAFPVNADGSAACAAYIGALEQSELTPIAAFVAHEARRYGVQTAEPVNLQLYPPLERSPPTLPPRAGVLSRVLFVLRLRYYRWQTLHDLDRSRARPQIVLFLLFHDPAHAVNLPHSLGLQRGLMGVVHLYADPRQSAQNAIVTAHELLHTFGATDKYSPFSDAPLFPQGYADPELEPLYPQYRAELMAGRMALSATAQAMPETLQDVLIGPASAREIGWIPGP